MTDLSDPQMGELRDEFVRRLSPTYSANNERYACWPFIGSISTLGYGRIKFRRRWYFAHRASWVATFGPIPSGLNVCHACDNPACVNPNHLMLGTNIANSVDRDRKGRTHGFHGERQGARNPRSKITDDIARLIFNRASNGERQIVLALEYGVSDRTIRSILDKTKWSHIHHEPR